MDFFGQQERARINTRRLVVLFILALVLTNLAVYLAVAGALRGWYWFELQVLERGTGRGWLTRVAQHFSAEGFWSWELLGWVTLLVTLLLVTVSGYKLGQLSKGGGVVARDLGGRWVNPGTADPDERRLLNVVEELAIASGLPVPEVYLLEEESGINAFAAGNEPSDAALGVTFGALKLLTRDEMQGMMAHEFSHILNGDMRLNTRLIGWLQGVLGLVVLGRILTLQFISRHEIGERGERVGPVFHPALFPAFVLGWICMGAGSLGALAARLIKSSVNRQREYLADAAAVQFTRNPEGLAGALKKIGGLQDRSYIAAGRAEEASHMYFADGMRSRWLKFLATHPTLLERIRRLEPEFHGRFPWVSLERVLRESKVTELYREQGDGRPLDMAKLASVIGPAAAAREMLYARAARETPARDRTSGTRLGGVTAGMPWLDLAAAGSVLAAIPDGLRTVTQRPAGALTTVYALLCSKEPETRKRQLAGLSGRISGEAVGEVERLLPPLAGLDERHYLSLAVLAVRTLRQLSAEDYRGFRANLEWLIAEDQQMDLFEYMLERMIVRHLDPHYLAVQKPPTEFYILAPLVPHCSVLLSGLARIGNADPAKAEAAFRQGAALLPEGHGLRFLPLVECDLLHIDAALDQLARAAAPVKQQVFAALTSAASADGQLQRREAELLRAFADAVGLTRPM